MRVIAGTARGRRLRVPRVVGLRPTGDRARESLFNVLRPRLEGARVLDLFAGSGALGIEALSRGAATCDFVERHARAREVIVANLEHCGLEERGRVHGGDWRRALQRLAEQASRFDLVLADPPWAWRGAHECLEVVARQRLLERDGVVVLEHRVATPPRRPPGWRRLRSLVVGDTGFALFEKSTDGAEAIEVAEAHSVEGEGEDVDSEPGRR